MALLKNYFNEEKVSKKFVYEYMYVPDFFKVKVSPLCS